MPRSCLTRHKNLHIKAFTYAQKHFSLNTTKMDPNEGRLNQRQWVRLSKAISGPDMETIALGYLDFEDEEIKSLNDEHKGHVQRINRDILQKWCNKNSGNIQTKVSLMRSS